MSLSIGDGDSAESLTAHGGILPKLWLAQKAAKQVIATVTKDFIMAILTR